MASQAPQDSAAQFFPQISKLREIIAKDPSGTGWDTLWQQNITPWDQGQMQRPLKQLVESKKVPLPTSGKAIVPGCGRGYEAVFIAARLGLDTIGMDISPIAIDAANKNLKMTAVPQDAKISYNCTNFFDIKAGTEEDKYDLAFDYTFFVAIPPALRPSWGSQMRQLVKKGGYLVALIWPIDGDRPGGPPYSVDVGMYAEALQADVAEGNWTKVLDEDTANEERVGTERIVVWKRE